MQIDSVKQPKKRRFQNLKIFFSSFFGDLQFLSLQKVSLKSTKIHETFFIMESKHISIFDVNISSYGHGQVSLLTFDQDWTNGMSLLWLHHIQMNDLAMVNSFWLNKTCDHED